MHSFILRAAILPLFTLGIVATGCGYAPGVDGDPSAPPPGPPDIQFTLDDAAGPGLPPEECSVEAVTSFPRVNLFIAVDRSAAMLYSNRWNMTTGALGAFINDAKSAGLRVALGFFPADACGQNMPLCSQPECGDLTVPLGAIGPIVGEAHGKALVDTLKKVQPQIGGNTPEESALKLAEGWAVGYATQHPNETTILAFVSALSFEVCGIDLKSLATTAAKAKDAGVLTYAFGFNSTSFPGLEAIAKAGGTGSPTILSDVNANNELFTGLKGIRGNRLACRMAAPGTEVKEILFTPTNSPLDFPLAQVSGPNGCGTEPAYYIDTASKPHQIAICPVTCSEARADGTATVELDVGCRY